jgi:RNA recognition motif-containing protein
MNIYVGNLPFATTTEELEELFAKHGAVTKAEVISDRYSGRSRGFGFVEMADDAEGNAAIEALNEFELGGRNLKVNETRPKEDRAPRERRGGGGGRY